MKYFAILALLLLALGVMLGGCTLLGGVAGLATGVVDCTYWHVTASGPAGLIYLPLGPLEGGYRGMQLGWYADTKAFNGQEGPNILAHVAPCTTNAAFSIFGGKGLSWDMR